MTFSCLICALNLCSKVAQKGKICSRVLEPQKVVQKLPSTIGRGLVALDNSRLGLENNSNYWETNQANFLLSTSLLYKILPTNLGVCKPTFYTFYTSHLRWNSTIYHTDLVQNAVFHKFSRQIALSQYTFRTIYPVLLAKPFKKFLKSPTRPAGSHFWQQKRQFAVRTVVKCLNEH